MASADEADGRHAGQRGQRDPCAGAPHSLEQPGLPLAAFRAQPESGRAPESQEEKNDRRHRGDVDDESGGDAGEGRETGEKRETGGGGFHVT